MKKIFAIAFFISAMCSFTYSQSLIDEFEKIKEIKLLESTRDDVKKILVDYKLDLSDDERFYQLFSKGNNFSFTVSYSDGTCGDSESWNISAWKVVSVEISPKNKVDVENSGFDFSTFTKERHYANISDSYVYHNRDKGIAFEIANNAIQKIVIFPPKKNYLLVCSKKAAKRYYFGKSIFGKTKLEDRVYITDPTSDVTNLTLSATEIIADCANGDEQNKSCSDDNKKIIVDVKSTDDDENGMLKYEYAITGGKIVGEGKQIVWDLSDTKPGTYKITAGVNDGCGICGRTITKTVIIKECPDCSVK